MRFPLSPPSYLPSRGPFLSFQNSCGVVSPTRTVPNSLRSPPLPLHSTETSNKAVESAAVHTSEDEVDLIQMQTTEQEVLLLQSPGAAPLCQPRVLSILFHLPFTWGPM